MVKRRLCGSDLLSRRPGSTFFTYISYNLLGSDILSLKCVYSVRLLVYYVQSTSWERDPSAVAPLEVSFFSSATRVLCGSFSPHLNQGSKDKGCCSLYRLWSPLVIFGRFEYKWPSKLVVDPPINAKKRGRRRTTTTSTAWHCHLMTSNCCTWKELHSVDYRVRRVFAGVDVFFVYFFSFRE